MLSFALMIITKLVSFLGLFSKLLSYLKERAKSRKIQEQVEISEKAHEVVDEVNSLKSSDKRDRLRKWFT